MKNILVGVDFKTSDKPLIEMATELATMFRSKVWLVHVSAPEPEYVGYSVGPQYIREDRSHVLHLEHKQLESMVKDFHFRNIQSESLLIQGGTVRMLLDESYKLDIDLVVLGHHKHTIFHKAFVGCTDTEMIKRSRIPVLIVPIKN